MHRQIGHGAHETVPVQHQRAVRDLDHPGPPSEAAHQLQVHWHVGMRIEEVAAVVGNRRCHARVHFI